LGKSAFISKLGGGVINRLIKGCLSPLPRSTRSYFFFIFLLTGFGWFPSGAVSLALAKPPPITVLYPDVREPYRSVFTEIIKGIENRLSGPITTYMLEKNFDIAVIKRQLASVQTQVVVALGSRGLLAARHLSPEFKVIVGAVLIDPNSENMTGISLIPDPGEIFRRLKKWVPGLKGITVIYSRKQNEWLIEKARKSAAAHQLEFKAFPVTDIHQAATLYRDVLKQLRRNVDAVWLPPDEMLDEQAILPLVLQLAWERNLIVFSSNLAHIKRGAAFVLYPDNEGMGRSLAELALPWLHDKGEKLEGIRLLRDLSGAVNLRTTEHLGLMFSPRQMQELELTLPVQ
jgi:putative tryptophan/tyrosine transport system substrate-binding protein